MKKVIVSVINDLVTDQRVHKVCATLHKLGFEVVLVGREQRNSLKLDKRDYFTKRMRLLFERGPLFYLEFNCRLFFFLLFHRSDVLVSNDLDTLFPNYVISLLKGSSLVYDTHEIYTEVPELQNRPFKRKIWEGLERNIFPKLKYVFTVNESIAFWYKNKYGIEPKVVRNIPRGGVEAATKTRQELNLPVDGRILIMQGAGINVQRGAEETVEAMKYVNDALLLMIGGGDVIDELKLKTERDGLNERVRFIGKLPYTELMQYTRNADIGITLDKDTNINYRYSLPNKLFDYIHAGIAVLASHLTEIEKIIRHYNVGNIIDDHDPKHIAHKINSMLENKEQLNKWKENSKHAARELTWENEEQELIKVYKLLM
ncbi:MAG: glycosyltransferase [Bacteroidetes bacterium]|nr:glycosyltransferase [Bacteroidota bacterium]